MWWTIRLGILSHNALEHYLVHNTLEAQRKVPPAYLSRNIPRQDWIICQIGGDTNHRSIFMNWLKWKGTLVSVFKDVPKHPNLLTLEQRGGGFALTKAKSTVRMLVWVGLHLKKVSHCYKDRASHGVAACFFSRFDQRNSNTSKRMELFNWERRATSSSHSRAVLYINRNGTQARKLLSRWERIPWTAHLICLLVHLTRKSRHWFKDRARTEALAA